MIRYLSEVGVVGFSDHEEYGEVDNAVVDDCVTYATNHIFGLLATRYAISAIANASILPELATIIACRTLCLRRGNPIPDSLEMRYQEIIARDGLLEEIAKGDVKLIDANGNILNSKGGFAPSFSNLTVDRRYRQENIRVVTGSSPMLPTRLEVDSQSRWPFDG
jgi:phage gp36-like protein